MKQDRDYAALEIAKWLKPAARARAAAAYWDM